MQKPMQDMEKERNHQLELLIDKVLEIAFRKGWGSGFRHEPPTDGLNLVISQKNALIESFNLKS